MKTQAASTPTFALILVLLAASGCGVGEAKLDGELIAAAGSPLPVRTAQAQLGELFARYQATSNIAADGEAEVPARIDGEVIETLVEEGDPVQQGQLLARIDAERLRLRMQRTKAKLAKTESEYRRQLALHEKGLVSRAAFEGLKYDVADLRATHGIDRLNYSYAEIRAPISGVISKRNIRRGQHVKSGDLAFRITDTSRLLAILVLPQREMTRFGPGQQATVAVDAYPGRVFDAEIARISPTVDAETGSIRATAYIDNQSGDLAPGMFGRFDIRYEKHSGSLYVPASGISREDGDTVVYRIDDGTAHRQIVEIGIISGDRVEVLSGLSAGDEIVVSGSSGLRNGTRVLASAATETSGSS